MYICYIIYIEYYYNVGRAWTKSSLSTMRVASKRDRVQVGLDTLCTYPLISKFCLVNSGVTSWRRLKLYKLHVCLCVMMWCDVMWCDVMWCDVMWCDVMWCDVSDVMWCDVMWCFSVMYVQILDACAWKRRTYPQLCPLWATRHMLWNGWWGLLPSGMFAGDLWPCNVSVLEKVSG